MIRYGAGLFLLCLLDSVGAAATFRVSSATFTETTAEFGFAAQLGPNDPTARLTLTLAPGSVDPILASVHCSASLNVGVDASGSTTKVILSAASGSETVATIRFSRPFIQNECRLLYGLDTELKELSAAVLLTDKSGSDAAWLDADVVYLRKSGTLKFRIDRLSAGASMLSPSTEIHSYKLGLDPAPYFRTGEERYGTDPTKAYHVLQMQNTAPGAIGLPGGAIRVFAKDGVQYDRVLPIGLAVGEGLDLYAAEMPELAAAVATTPASGTRSIELLSIDRGLVRTRQWNGKTIVVTNRSASPLDVRLGAKSTHPYRVHPAPRAPLDGFLRDVPSAVEERSLLAIANEDLGKAQAFLASLQIVRHSDQALLEDVKQCYINIDDARKTTAAAKAIKSHLDAALSVAAAANTPPTILARIKAENDKAVLKEQEALGREGQAFEALVRLLFP